MNYEQAYKAIIKKMPQNFDDDVEGVIIERKLKQVMSEDLLDIVEAILSNSGWTDFATVKRVIDNYVKKGIDELDTVAKQESNKIYQKMTACFEVYDRLRIEKSADIKSFRFTHYLRPETKERLFADKELEIIGEAYKALKTVESHTAFECLYNIVNFLDNRAIYREFEQAILNKMKMRYFPTALQAPKATNSIFDKLANKQKRLA